MNCGDCHRGLNHKKEVCATCEGTTIVKEKVVKKSRVRRVLDKVKGK